MREQDERQGLWLGLGLTLSMLVSWVLKWQLGEGSNAGLVPAATLGLILLVRPHRIWTRLQQTTAPARVGILCFVLVLLAAQVIHFGSWRMHRDDYCLLAAGAIALSLGAGTAPFVALRLYGALLALVFFSLYAFLPDAAVYEGLRFGGPLHPNATALQCTLAVIALLWWPGGPRLARAALVLVLLVVIYICGSRMALASALLAIAAFCALVAGRRRLTAPRALLGGLIAGGLALYLTRPVWQDFILRHGSLEDLYRLGGRSTIWPAYAKLAWMEPFIGLGDRGLNRAIDSGTGQIQEIIHAHNAWLNMAVQRGIPYALLAGGLLCAAVARLARPTAATFSPFGMESSGRQATLVIFGVALFGSLMEPLPLTGSDNGGWLVWLLVFLVSAPPHLAAETLARPQ